MTCPSKFEVARLEASGALSATTTTAHITTETSHVRGCPRCQAVLEQLNAARQELLGADPVEGARLQARRLLTVVEERKRARRWWSRLWVPAAVLPVAAGVALFALTPAHTTTGDEVVATNRAKGPLVLEVFAKRGEQVFPVTDGGDFVAGDRLRFAYTKGEPGYLMVFSVDDGGRVSPYYRDAILAGIEARPGSKVALPDSVELDDHRGWERVFALWSTRPIEEDKVRTAVAEALRTSDVRQMSRLNIDAEQATVLLHRP